MQKKYYKSRYFFLFLFIASFLYLAINFWQLSGFNFSRYQARVLRPYNTEGVVMGSSNDSLEYDRYGLIIDKINVSAPIIFDVNGENENEYNAALLNGVAHLDKSAKPGQKGSIVIFGHSSASFGALGDYNYIFSNLDKLEEFDEISIINLQNENKFTYKVYAREVVEADNTSILDKIDENILILFTCWPVGTDEQRLVIYAKPE